MVIVDTPADGEESIELVNSSVETEQESEERRDIVEVCVFFFPAEYNMYSSSDNSKIKLRRIKFS